MSKQKKRAASNINEMISVQANKLAIQTTWENESTQFTNPSC